MDEHPTPLDRVFVIGDTPYDIGCGRAIGVRTLAVASGDYSVEMLLEHGPWRAISRLPEPGASVAMLNEGD